MHVRLLRQKYYYRKQENQAATHNSNLCFSAWGMAERQPEEYSVSF